MKLISFMNEDIPGYGVVQDDRVLDVSAVLRTQFPDLKSIVLRNAWDKLRDACRSCRSFHLDSVELMPPIPNPSKIFCIGHNYEEHRLETGRPKTTFPSIFFRFADSQVGHGQSALIPRVSSEIDFEGELAVVIGKPGRYIPAAEALSHVAGYSCYNDISVRDWQRHTTQFGPGKNFPCTGGFGPWLVTTDEIRDPQALELTTKLNGHVVQHASTSQMIFTVGELIEYCSSFTPLTPGDVIVSGTPGGVGMKRTPPLYMAKGDAVEVEISRIGTLRLTMEKED
ncbi:MAG: fumarylacetoacetate hydrolase family protein [Acidobacteriaceae bacterium]|nr:fumarylacetoacetate hydrolase family protein [Acidobacteriaceae bacterium]